VSQTALLKQDLAVRAIEFAKESCLGFVRNSLSQPCAVIQSTEGEKIVLIHSGEFREWLASTFYDSFRNCLTTTAQREAACVIAGWARACNRTEQLHEETLWHIVDREPLLQAILNFMDDGLAREHGMTDLLTKLRSVAGDNHIDCRHHRWPRSPAILSARLRKFEPMLRQLGIQIRIWRTRRGAQARLSVTVCDGLNQPSSHQSSSINNRNNQDLQPHDDCDASKTNGENAGENQTTVKMAANFLG
jgi:hypothetical protein